MADQRLDDLARRARAASRELSRAPSGTRDAALGASADLVELRSEAILEANAGDVERAEEAGTPAALVDRLRLSRARVSAMAEGLRTLAAIPDPVGRVVDGWVRPNGLRVRRVRVPLGVVGVIYEGRPNVTADAAGLALRSGNAVILRGSSSALDSNRAVAACHSEALAKVGLPPDAALLVEDTSREGAAAFMGLTGGIDCLVPRGGPSLLAAVAEHATVPVVTDGAGNCHVYVDESADIDTAVSIVVNAKRSRPGVCNAVETLLVHRSVAPELLAALAPAMEGVELRADPRAAALLPASVAATEQDWSTEYLDLVLAVGVVDSLDEALRHIARYGTGHSEAIVTTDVRASTRFVGEVDAAAVLVNCSTRFVDGSELGFGAEIGISTQKLHVRGPMGAEALTCVKLVIEGDGQVRG
ncbi:MAG: glutamate-5-semialdehyde dehydrogenase [Acidimicrobiales bacterium]